MPCCAAINCSRKCNQEDEGNGISFHRFPLKQPELLQKWLRNMRRDKYTPSKSAILCSAHFEAHLYYKGERRRLLPDAVPTIFDFPKHLQKDSKATRKPPKPRTVMPMPMHSAEEGRLSTDHFDSAGPSGENLAGLSTGTDHTYHVLSTSSPRKLKRRLEESIDRNSTLHKKLKISNQKVRRLQSKITTIHDIITTLKEQGLLSRGCEDVLEKNSGAPRQILERALNEKPGKNGTYPDELKSFAITLQFYSTKAYNFVRETFHLALPHPSVIRRWYSSIPGSPGFTQSAFSALKHRVDEAESKGRKVMVALMLDEMSIRKHIQWDGKQFHGYVAIGNDDFDDSTPLAKDALVIMAVALNDSWKIPCGYFLIHGLSGDERANLIRSCIERLYDTGVIVVSLTCDGPSCHCSMLRHLGACLDPENMDPSFEHPCDPSQRVYVMLDSCHMLKLARNTLGDMKVLVDKDGELIRWDQIVALNELQQKQGLHLANKLRMSHIQYHKQKMKVSMAAQTLSSSVADAIEFAKTLGSKEDSRPFQASEGTVKFVRFVDTLFDILNSRHPLAKGFKAPLRLGNVEQWGPFLTEAEEYISGLQDQTGTPLVQSRRKTAFVGFLACIKSVRGLFETYVASKDAPLKYLLTYKMSQDHLELFFCSIRASGRANNNPTAQQFSAAYKRLLMHHNIKGSGGNCLQLDSTRVLEAQPCAGTDDSGVTVSDITLARKYDLTVQSRDDLEDISESEIQQAAQITTCSSEFKFAVVSYTAGFVCRMVKRQISCQRCCGSLCAGESQTHPFIRLKDKGGLLKPSPDVVAVCAETDHNIRKILHTTNNRLPQGPGIPSVIATTVLSQLHNKVFLTLSDHDLDTSVDENHIFKLIKTISFSYTKVIFHHLAKVETDVQTGIKIRKQVSKLILFKHQ